MNNKKSDQYSDFRIAFKTIVFVIVLLTGGANALSNPGDGNWKYFKDITITNNGAALADYQVLINLTGNTFPTEALKNGEDIRFTDDNGNELSYWIENWDYSSKKAIIWVKVPTIQIGTTLRMFYGNPNAASASNGSAAFEFFDDFSGTALDNNKWNINNNPTVNVANGIVTITGDGAYEYIKSKTSWSGSVALRTRQMTYNQYPPYPVPGEFGFGYYSWPPSSNCVAHVFATSSQYYVANENYSNRNVGGRVNLDYVWHTWDIMWHSSGTKLFKDGVTEATLSGSIPASSLNVSFGIFYDARFPNKQDVDWVLVRKYNDREPTVIISPEKHELSENFTIAHITDIHLGYYPWTGNFFNFTNKEASMKDSVEVLTDTLQNIKNVHPDRVIITGDLVEYDDVNFFMAFKNLLKDYTIPVNIVPGNHDRRNLILVGDDLSNYNYYINKNINNLSDPNDNNYYFDFKGYRFIGIDSGSDRSAYLDVDKKSIDLSPEATGLSDEQMSRLKGEFNNSAPKIVFMHHPAISSKNDSIIFDGLVGIPPDGAPGGNDGTISTNRWNFINYSRDSNVQMVLTGHSHQNVIFDLTGQQVDATSLNRPLFIQTQYKGYRIIDVKDGKATPHDTSQLSGLIRTSSAASFINMGRAILGLHAIDSLGRHTGMIACSDDFELGIPDSYYTGNYGGRTVTPEAIVAYNNDTDIKKEITEFRIFSLCKAPASMMSATNNVPVENIYFNQSIEKQTISSTTELNFFNVSITESSVAVVNVSDAVSNYRMMIDLDGDGTADRIIFPDVIRITPKQPGSSIGITEFNGEGSINLSSSSGYFAHASSLNAESIVGKPPYEFPSGLLAFNISGLKDGEAIVVTITLPKNLSSSSKYWNYGITPRKDMHEEQKETSNDRSDDIVSEKPIEEEHNETTQYSDNINMGDSTSPWYHIPLGSNDGDNVVTLYLQDGGIGDDDMTANGIIEHVGGPGIINTGKVNGDGWISIGSNKKATFELLAHYVKGSMTPTGSIQYYDQAAGLKVRGTVVKLSVDETTGTSTFSGLADVNDIGGYTYNVTVVDNGESGKTDTFTIDIPALSYEASGILKGGNINIHKS
jgi:predicted MPP superfamily phosphohydrolase